VLTKGSRCALDHTLSHAAHLIHNTLSHAAHFLHNHVQKLSHTEVWFIDFAASEIKNPTPREKEAQLQELCNMIDVHCDRGEDVRLMGC